MHIQARTQALKEMTPLNPSKCRVFNLNFRQKPHPKLKMYFSSSVSLKCSLFQSQYALEKEGQVTG